jgi:hypothetical protein
MIRLFPGHALVVDEAGHSQTLDFDSLRDELAQCFARCGVSEAWLAEHVACIVEERVRERHRQSPGVLDRREVDEMVLASVRAVGFADVGERYAEIRGLTVALPRPSGSLEAWGEDRLRDLLERLLQLPGPLVDRHLPKLADALVRLGLEQVSDSLLRELALHLLAGETGDETEGLAAQPIRLFPDEHWLARLHGTYGTLLTSGILRVHPVSSALPRARVEFDIEKFGRRLGTPPLLEMQILSCLPPAARALEAMLGTVREDICSLRPSAAAHPGHIILRGMKALLAEQLQPLCARDAHAFLAEVRDCLQREVCAKAAFEVILSLR